MPAAGGGLIRSLPGIVFGVWHIRQGEFPCSDYTILDKKRK